MIPKVWQYHRQVHHYRVPIWDLMAGNDFYELDVFGETEDGRPLGGPKRSYVHHIDFKKLPLVGVSWVPGAISQIRNERPDVVMIQNDPYSALSWGAPSVVQSYGGVAIAWSKVTSFSSAPDIFKKFVKRRLFSMYDLSVVYGEAAAQELADLGYPRSKIFVATNTIDTRRIFTDGNLFKARGRKLRAQYQLDNARVLLCVASMWGKKRHRDLLEAWPRLCIQDPNLRMVFVGGGSCLDEIRAAAMELDPERIIVTGSVPEGDDYAWYSTADISVQCGGVGLGVNQSMAWGVPTIAADEPGPDSAIVVHGKTGWRYERGNIDRLVDTISQVISHPDEAREVAAEGRRMMRDEVTIEGMVEALNECILAGLELSRKKN